MSEIDPVAETIITDEELELDLTPDGTETVDELNAKLANAEKAKKQILARARKAEAEAKALKEAKPIITEDTSKSDEDSVWEVAEFIREGHSRSDVDFIRKNGGKEALKDPNSYVSLALKSIREQREAEEAASMTSGAGQSEIERKFTPEQLKNMSADEMEKHLPHTDN